MDTVKFMNALREAEIQANEIKKYQLKNGSVADTDKWLTICDLLHQVSDVFDYE